MSSCRIALVGDYDPAVTAHRAIPRALQLSATRLGTGVEAHWIATPSIDAAASVLHGFDGIWCVPATPYASMDGALAAVRYAREHGIPFLGTCGGFQHALIEFARNVAGIHAADHEETSPDTTEPVVTRLACALVEVNGTVHFTPESRLHVIYGAESAHEGYHCSFGVNPAYRERLEQHGLHFTAFADDGDVRAAEWPAHPFFVGTLFQPERAALLDHTHPLPLAFVTAAAVPRELRIAGTSS